MNICFLNNSNYIALIKFDEECEYLLEPFEKKDVEIETTNNVCITVKSEASSSVKQGKFILLLETTYIFNQINNNDCFIIFREKVRINNRVYYDRMFINCNDMQPVTTIYKVNDEKRLKHIYRKRRFCSFLLSPVEYFPKLFICLFMIGIPITYYTDPISAIAYYGLSYLLILFLSCIVKKFWATLFNKISINKETDSHFFSCFDSSNIESYYTNPNRTVFMNDIET